MLTASVIAALLAVAPLAGAENESVISAEREQELFAQVDSMIEVISDITGLAVRKPIPRALITRDEIRKLVETRLEQETKPGELHAEELFLKLFGFVEDDFDLAAQVIDVLTEQASALYDIKTKKLYMATWTPEDMQEFALVHELAHALADQHFNLEKYLKRAKGSDGQVARSAVMEGQASWIMTEYVMRESGRTLVGHRTVTEAAASASRYEAVKFPVYEKSPLYIKETLLFPYTDGMLFTQAVVDKLGKDGFAGVFRDAPDSTEQILEPALYFSRRKPAKIRLPKVKPGRGFKKVISGEVGQLDHYILLKQFAGEEAADELAPKWRGAAFIVLEDKKNDQAVLVYASEWESEADAERFFKLYRNICAKKLPGARFDSETPEKFEGASERGGFVVTRAGAVVTGIEGMPDDTLKAQLRNTGMIAAKTE